MTRDERISRDVRARVTAREELRRNLKLGLSAGSSASLAIETALAQARIKLTGSQESVVGAVLYALDCAERDAE